MQTLKNSGKQMDDGILALEGRLLKYLKSLKKPAVAFSGGVDSSLLLAACRKAGADAIAITADVPQVPQFEKEDVLRMAGETGTELVIIKLDGILKNGKFTENGPRRCYFCKKAILFAIKEKAEKLGSGCILDGTNLSDNAGDRPGMKAASEAGVVGPLALCGFKKKDVRALAGKYGLSVAKKSAYSCLATRIAQGEKITAAKLLRVEKAEEALKKMGLSGFRVRSSGDAARIEVRKDELSLAIRREKEMEKAVKAAGFASAELDMENLRGGE
ncbi:MAG: ATP-dependent sacrificial sulfur transferase LarE [Phascolarctobacterium sp.]|nr:ATP-dependent sacrificial sulfur transferase LarE [Phascolarctobacterium sp.]